jgi:hypothetical protein
MTFLRKGFLVTFFKESIDVCLTTADLSEAHCLCDFQNCGLTETTALVIGFRKKKKKSGIGAMVSRLAFRLAGLQAGELWSSMNGSCCCHADEIHEIAD